jgi:hypothetical protein
MIIALLSLNPTQALRGLLISLRDRAERIAAAVDKRYGADKTGAEMPDWIVDKKRRPERIRQAKAELEAEAKASAADFASSAPRFREGAGRVRLHRPQSSQACPTAESVCSAVVSEIAGDATSHHNTINAVLNIPTATIWSCS